MRVVATVLTYRAPDRLAACLASLRGQTRPPDEIIVIDNGAGMNDGPAGGHHRGIAAALDAGADMVWVMDDDVTADPACLEQLIAADGDVRWPTRTTSTGDIANYPGWYGPLLTRALIERVGLPRADLVWWIEDTEYLQRRMVANWADVREVPGAVTVHGDARPDSTRPAWKVYYETRNSVWYRLHHQRLEHPIKLARTVIRLAVSSRLSWPFWRGLVDGVAGRLGLRWPLP